VQAGEPVRIRAAERGDVALLLAMTSELAEYERLTHMFEATEQQLRDALFGERRIAAALLAERGDVPAGYAVFFPTFSTFLASAGVWLEDLFVRPEHRGFGVGRGLLAAVARRTGELGGKRLEWAALDWNEPALGFYERLGAHTLNDWLTHRLDGDALAQLAGEHSARRRDDGR
jgi:GNAT superfamily N-acetyltransferase